VPHGVVWPLPIYELALMTARRPAKHSAELAVVTSEEEPLGILGPAAVQAVSELLQEHGVSVQTGVLPMAVRDGTLTLAPAGAVRADRFVALPEQRGIELSGVPHDPGGFIRVDEHGRVDGLDNVFAAGDITTYSAKQGGVAAQQADAVAQIIAAEAGVAILPEPFRPPVPLGPHARLVGDLVRRDHSALLVTRGQDRRAVSRALPRATDRRRAAIALRRSVPRAGRTAHGAARHLAPRGDAVAALAAVQLDCRRPGRVCRHDP
jgi:hypothetical protein